VLIKYLAFFAVLTSSIAPVFAAEFGRSTVNGKQIILYDNGTWKVDSKNLAPKITENNCTAIRSNKIPLTLCLSESAWTTSRKLAHYQEYSFVSKEPTEIYAALIPERAFIAGKLLRGAILTTARSSASLEGVRVLRESKRVLNGQVWNQIEYSMKIADTRFFLLNIYKSEKGKGTAQFLMYTAAESPEALIKLADAVSIKFD
jgi:hypothetical protein